MARALCAMELLVYQFVHIICIQRLYTKLWMCVSEKVEIKLDKNKKIPPQNTYWLSCQSWYRDINQYVGKQVTTVQTPSCQEKTGLQWLAFNFIRLLQIWSEWRCHRWVTHRSGSTGVQMFSSTFTRVGVCNEGQPHSDCLVLHGAVSIRRQTNDGR